MKTKTTILIIVMGMIAGACSNWFNDYNQSTAFGISIRLLLAIVSFLASFAASLLFNERVTKITLLISAGVIMALAGRILFDLFIDSTSHNLFPFEMMIALSISVPCAFIGSLLASIFKRKVNR